MSGPRTASRLSLGAALILAWVSAVSLTLAMGDRKATPPGTRAAAPAVRQAPAGDYVGTDTCLTCHDDKKDQGPHGRAANPRTPMAGQGCETCHGAGKAAAAGSLRRLASGTKLGGG